MDATQALLVLVVVPIAAWAAAVLVLRGRFQDIQRDWMSRGQTPPFGRVVIANVYGAIPTVFGLLLWVMSRTFLDGLSGTTAPGALDANNLFQWAAGAYAVAACCTVAGQTIVVRSRLSSFLGSDFGRVLPISVIPFTDSIFALVLAFLVFGYLGDFVHGAPAATPSAAASAVSALQAYAVASLAMPISAMASNRVRDLSAYGFRRALIAAEIGEIPILLGLVMGFLAIGGLSPV